MCSGAAAQATRLGSLGRARHQLTVGAAFTSPAWAERLVEIEPFKAAISLHFQRPEDEPS